MAAQLGSLAEAAGRPNIALRVVPFGAGLHRGLMSGPFELLRFPLNGDGQALMVVASVVGMPWGKPWYVFSVPFCTS
jgi:hypothetical protein